MNTVKENDQQTKRVQDDIQQLTHRVEKLQTMTTTTRDELSHEQKILDILRNQTKSLEQKEKKIINDQRIVDRDISRCQKQLKIREFQRNQNEIRSQVVQQSIDRYENSIGKLAKTFRAIPQKNLRIREIEKPHRNDEILVDVSPIENEIKHLGKEKDHLRILENFLVRQENEFVERLKISFEKLEELQRDDQRQSSSIIDKILFSIVSLQ